MKGIKAIRATRNSILDTLNQLPFDCPAEFFAEDFECSKCEHTDCNQHPAYLQMNRQERIEAAMPAWRELGQRFQKVREGLSLDLAAVAHSIGIHKSRLKKFEEGLPVLDAKLIETGYRNFLELAYLRSELGL